MTVVRPQRFAEAWLRAATLVAIGLAGCGQSARSSGSTEMPRAPGGGRVSGDAASALVTGTLQVSWIHGSQDCNDNTDPEVQVHRYNATTYIVRQNKCRTFEAPFVYVLIGDRTALSLDTGATPSSTLRDTIQGLIGSRPLIAAHSHGHGDHKASDTSFAGQPGVTLVANTVEGQQAAFGIASWPADVGHYDLGGRVLDVLAIPGHQPTHIAIYDRQTGLLLTGDSLYPGLLFVRDWTAYRDSMHRLAQFAATRPISYVLGAHIEMTRTPKITYPYGTTYQPEEHVLQLTAAHLVELDQALIRLGPDKPATTDAHDDFIIDPT